MTIWQILQYWTKLAWYNIAGWYCYFHGHDDRWEGICNRCTEPYRPTLADWVWGMRQQWHEYFPDALDETDFPF